jgi:hypothetical protein
MKTRELLMKLMSRGCNFINMLETMDGDAFSVTGTIIRVDHGNVAGRYNFDFHSMPDGGHYVLDLIEKN